MTRFPSPYEHDTTAPLAGVRIFTVGAVLLLGCIHAPPPTVVVQECLHTPPPQWVHVPTTPCPAGAPAGMACFADADGHQLAVQVAALREWADGAWQGCGAK